MGKINTGGVKSAKDICMDQQIRCNEIINNIIQFLVLLQLQDCQVMWLCKTL